MDTGEFLNILLMLLVISFALIVTYRLAYLNMKYLTAVNPFTIHQIAVTINYFSSNLGNFEAIVDSPGLELVEYRIAKYRQGIFGYKAAYVSSGVCEAKNHLQELLFDVINSALSTLLIFSPVFSNLKGLGTQEFAKFLVKTVMIESVKAYLISKAVGGVISIINIFGSAGMHNIQDVIFSAVTLKSLQLKNLAKLAEDAKQDLISNIPQNAAKIAIAGIVRFLITKALISTGVGIIIAFALNFIIEFADNLIAAIRGATDVEYNCLYNPHQHGVQMIFNLVEKIEYNPNTNIDMIFENVGECGIALSEFQGNYVYKITGYQPCANDKAYLLTNISINKDEGANKINIKANYKEVKKK